MSKSKPDTWEDYLSQPRYDLSLQKENDVFCYKDFFSCKTFKEAKKEADKVSIEEGREVIVFDRHEFFITYRTGVKNEDIRQ